MSEPLSMERRAELRATVSSWSNEERREWVADATFRRREAAQAIRTLVDLDAVCGFQPAMLRVCLAEKGRCAEHGQLRCARCGSVAVRECCGQRMNLICGNHLCSDCECCDD